MDTRFFEVVQFIKQAHYNALKAVNTELINLYWRIGEHISQKIARAEWGQSVVKELADYIRQHEPTLKGFSDKNLWRMKQFYEVYKDSPKLSPAVREISWTHNLMIFSRCKTAEEREFYLKLCKSECYSKRELDRQISASLFERTMLGNTQLPPPFKENPFTALNAFKDSYVFEFLDLQENHSESELQQALIRQMRKFVAELGRDFLFMGEEFRVQVGNSDFFIDLLFYHRGLQCLVAVELKTGKFKPEYIGQLNFYLEALDRDVKKMHENPSIGILLCKDKDQEVVEYALSRSLSPTMVAEYQMQLPDKKVLQQKFADIFAQRPDADLREG